MSDRNVRYLGKRDRATGTKTFTLERPDGFDYEPGQFLYIMIPSGEAGDRGWLEHHFSFSSSPTEPNVEFTTRMTGHVFKDRLDEIEPGTTVWLAGPDGDFVLRPEMRRVAFVVGGIGVTPARSTVRWALDTGADVDIVVLYGNRDLASTAFREEFDAIRSDRVRVVNVLSEPDEGWTGRTGRIDSDLVRDEVADRMERYFFVSGPPPMVAALKGMLSAEVGIAADHLVTEDFPGYE